MPLAGCHCPVSRRALVRGREGTVGRVVAGREYRWGLGDYLCGRPRPSLPTLGPPVTQPSPGLTHHPNTPAQPGYLRIPGEKITKKSIEESIKKR